MWGKRSFKADDAQIPNSSHPICTAHNLMHTSAISSPDTDMKAYIDSYQFNSILKKSQD